jgi:hypothetical protein
MTCLFIYTLAYFQKIFEDVGFGTLTGELRYFQIKGTLSGHLRHCCSLIEVQE